MGNSVLLAAIKYRPGGSGAWPRFDVTDETVDAVLLFLGLDNAGWPAQQSVSAVSVCSFLQGFNTNSAMTAAFVFSYLVLVSLPS